MVSKCPIQQPFEPKFQAEQKIHQGLHPRKLTAFAPENTLLQSTGTLGTQNLKLPGGGFGCRICIKGTDSMAAFFSETTRVSSEVSVVSLFQRRPGKRVFGCFVSCSLESLRVLNRAAHLHVFFQGLSRPKGKKWANVEHVNLKSIQPLQRSRLRQS